MNDQFGNYVCQKFIETCDKNYITKMINKVIFNKLRLNHHFIIFLQIIMERELSKNS